MKEQTKWNAVFLLDKNPPTKILMLKRAPGRHFAPNFYTGVGGKVDPEDKSVLESAYRELKEEAGISGVKLTEFARCIIDRKYTLYYFWGLLEGDPPQTDDGILEWVDTRNVLEKKIIPTTEAMCKEWEKRRFEMDRPFTIHLKSIGKKDSVLVVEKERIEEGVFED